VVIAVEATTSIGRPIDDVWSYMSDLSNITEWDPEAVDVVWQPPITVGSTFAISAKFLVRTATATARITELEPRRRIGWEVDERRRWLGLSHRLRVRVSYTMEVIDAANTRLSRREDADLHGAFFRLMWPIIVLLAKRDRAEEIANVRGILEARP
jgi:hypothetical protein